VIAFELMAQPSYSRGMPSPGEPSCSNVDW
jgi:hypothetical protein